MRNGQPAHGRDGGRALVLVPRDHARGIVQITLLSPDTNDLNGITSLIAGSHGIVYSGTGCPVCILPGDLGDGKFRNGQVTQRPWPHEPETERETSHMCTILCYTLPAGAHWRLRPPRALHRPRGLACPCPQKMGDDRSAHPPSLW